MDPSRAALEALGLEAYRQRRITGYQPRTLLGIPSHYQFDGFLKEHQVEKASRSWMVGSAGGSGRISHHAGVVPRKNVKDNWRNPCPSCHTNPVPAVGEMRPTWFGAAFRTA